MRFIAGPLNKQLLHNLFGEVVFDYIELFYNPTRRHGHAANLSPVNYERQYLSEATNRQKNPGRLKLTLLGTLAGVSDSDTVEGMARVGMDLVYA